MIRWVVWAMVAAALLLLLAVAERTLSERTLCACHEEIRDQSP